MLAVSVKAMLFCGAIGIVSGCSTPCEAPGRLCAPISSIISAAPLPRRAAPVPVSAAPEAETYSVASPDSALLPNASGTMPASAPIRIGLLLPLSSETLGPAAESLRAGFMAAYERESAGFAVSVLDTGELSQNILSSYAQAQEQHDLIVGPLARSAVGALAASTLVHKPTIALNHPEAGGSNDINSGALPPNMLVMGLSIEQEARQVAAWAATEQVNANALIVSAGAPWQRRSASAFAQRWQRMGRTAESIDLSISDGYLSDAGLLQLRARVQNDAPALLFAALDANQARQLRVALGNTIPVYGTSSLNPGSGRGGFGPELDGVRLLDLPWQVQRDHPAVMVYPHPLQINQSKDSADMERLYALGIDAFRVAREIALHPAARFDLDGVTGRLAVSFGQGAARFERVEQAATVQNGVLVPLRSTPVALP